MTEATSRGCPRRFKGMRGISADVSGDSMAVSISPGATAFTRTPSSANSTAISRVSDDKAAFEVERSEEHTSELQSLMRISYAVFCLKKKITSTPKPHSYKH